VAWCGVLAAPTPSDRRALIAGAVVLAVVAVVYPIVAEDTGRPLAVFVLPSLLAAALGGWRPTLAIGGASLAIAVAISSTGPLDGESLAARWAIIALGLVLGVAGAWIRERQASQLEALNEAVALREAFERALAPEPIPPDGVIAIARYRAAESQMHLGGDFLEAVTLADGRLAVLIGDVCGHGPREAAFGTALRAGWKSIVLGAPTDPAEWVDALDRSFFRDGRIHTFATVCTGYFDVDAQSCRFVNAGHPRPVRLGATPQLLDLPARAPLGVGPPRRREGTEVVWSGEPILFYTDGLIENPKVAGPPERWDHDGLLIWLGDHLPATDPQALLRSLMADATAERDVRDDVALLLVAADR
jgi:hypothetical protein